MPGKWRPSLGRLDVSCSPHPHPHTLAPLSHPAQPTQTHCIPSFPPYYLQSSCDTARPMQTHQYLYSTLLPDLWKHTNTCIPSFPPYLYKWTHKHNHAVFVKLWVGISVKRSCNLWNTSLSLTTGKAAFSREYGRFHSEEVTCFIVWGAFC